MFQTLLIQPLYNFFIFLIDVMPGGDVGLAIIALTVIIRFLFYPIFASQIRTTMGMQALQGELEEIKQKYKDDKTKQGVLTLELYKKYKINPFSLIFSLIIQIPILIALYYAFFHTALPAINTPLLYSFVHEPQTVNIDFLGILDLTLPHNLIIVGVVVILQVLVVRLSLARTNKHMATQNLSEEKLAVQKMQQQVTMYTLPLIIAIVSYTTPAAVGLYFAIGNIVSLGQEWLIRRELSKKAS